MDAADWVALLTGAAGLVTAAGGVLLAVRAVRDKERKAAQEEIATLQGLLGAERRDRVDAELAAHRLEVLLARHGIDPANGPAAPGSAGGARRPTPPDT